MHKKKAGFTDLEIYILRKLVLKVKQDLNYDDHVEAVYTMTLCLISNLLTFSCFFLLSYSVSDFRVTSLNLNGARDVRKRACLFELLNLRLFYKKHMVMFLMRLSGRENGMGR